MVIHTCENIEEKRKMTYSFSIELVEAYDKVNRKAFWQELGVYRKRIKHLANKKDFLRIEKHIFRAAGNVSKILE